MRGRVMIVVKQDIKWCWTLPIDHLTKVRRAATASGRSGESRGS